MNFDSTYRKVKVENTILTFLPLKVARDSFSRPIPPKFEDKLRRYKQSFGKIATTVVLDKDEGFKGIRVVMATK